MTSGRGSLRAVILLLAALFISPLFSLADTTRTQAIPIRAGWNAVFLEVSPADSEPGAVFTNTPIDMVASYFAPPSSAQFMSDPSVDMLRQAGWGVWYGPARPDAFLSTLHAIYGQRAYLIHATAAFTWRVSGEVELPDIRWQPDCFNLVGFALDALAPPTYAQFFAGSAAHDLERIFRLVDGSWQRVANPSAVSMRSGEAFWVYCKRSSRYMGPVTVKTGSYRSLVIGSDPGELILRNEMPHPVSATLEHLPQGTNAVPLSLVVQSLGETNQPYKVVATPLPDGAWTQNLPPLETGEASAVPLAVRLGAMKAYRHSSLIRISTDIGTETWVPVVGLRRDLEDN